MGCAETKELTREEQAIINAEETLELHLQHCTEVDSIFRKYSTNGYINHQQLLRISEILGFSVENTLSNKKVHAFFEKLLADNNLYPLKDLLVIGLLLSEGSSEEKSRLLYEIYDVNMSDSLDIYDIKSKMFKDIIYHSVYSLSVLLSEDQIGLGLLNKTKKYVEELISISAVSVNKVANLFGITHDITSEKFVEIFSKILSGTLTNSSGWRRFMAETFQIEPPKKTFEPFMKVTRQEILGK